MTNQIQNELLNILKDSKDFVVTQAPDVVQQILAYEFWSSLLGIALGVFFTAVGVLIVRKAIQESKKDCQFLYEGFIYIGAFAGAMMITFGFVGGIYDLNNIIKIKTAPKYYLLDKVSSLGKCK